MRLGLSHLGMHARGLGGGAAGGLSGMFLGMNVGWITYYTGSYHFANLMYTASPWQGLGTVSSFSEDQGILTATVSTDQFRAYISSQGKGLFAGTYTVLNPQGANIGIGPFGGPVGTLNIRDMNNVPITLTGNYTNATQFKFDYDPATTTGLYVFCQGSLSNTLGNLAVLLPGTLSSWQGGNIWNPAFLSFMQGLSPKVLRMMDATNASTTIEDAWTTRVRPDKITLNSYYAGKYNGGMQATMPWEFIVDLSNRLGVDCWYNIPTRAMDDYVTGLANILNNGTGAVGTIGNTGLSAGRKAYIELGNEVWNNGNPWAEGTNWITYYNFTKYTATPTPDTGGTLGTGYWTLAGHGLTTGDYVHAFSSIQNRQANPSAQNYMNALGAKLYVEVIDTNTFRLRASSTGSYAPVASGIVNQIYCKDVEAGKTADLNGNYATVSLHNWDILDSIVGSSRIIHLCCAKAADTSTTTGRLSVAGMTSRTNYVAIAPYFSGVQIAANVAVAADNSITPSVWLNKGGTVYAGLYASGANPTDAAVIAGTGVALGAMQTISASAGVSTYTAGTAITGGVTSTAYDLVLLFCPTGWPERYRLTVPVTPSGALQPTISAFDSYANQALRGRLFNIEGSGSGSSLIQAPVDQVTNHIAVAGGIPVIAYEGGPDFSDSKPSDYTTWVDGYLESAELASLLTTNLNMLDAAGMKLFCYYVDNNGGPAGYQIADDYTDTVDQRYQAYSAKAGNVPARALLALADNNLPDILVAPTLPYTVATFSTGRTYTLVSGDDARNCSIVGNTLVMNNTAGIDWTTPTPRQYKILASNGNIDDVFLVKVSTGQAWYASDSSAAWDSNVDTDATVVNLLLPTSATMPQTAGASPATIVSGMWDCGGIAQYNANPMTANISYTKPIFMAFIADKDNLTATSGAGSEMFGIGSNPFIRFKNTGSGVGWRMFCTAPSYDTTYIIGSWTGGTKAVYWILLDPVAGKVYFGVNQTQINGAGGNAAPTSLPTTGDKSVYMYATEEKKGPWQIVNRTGMTVTDALTLVQNMQTKFGI